MIIAIDFDGTIVEHEFPNIGPLKLNAKEVINHLIDEGHQIIIWTCRTTQNAFPGRPCTIFDVANFLVENGILFHTINNNAVGLNFQPSPKIYADIYIDDKQLGGIPDDWNDILEIIKQHPQYESN